MFTRLGKGAFPNNEPTQQQHSTDYQNGRHTIHGVTVYGHGRTELGQLSGFVSLNPNNCYQIPSAGLTHFSSTIFQSDAGETETLT